MCDYQRLVKKDRDLQSDQFLTDFSNVVETRDLTATWNYLDPGACYDDYLGFLDKAAEYSHPQTDRQISQAFTKTISSKPFLTPPPDALQLRKNIVDRLNIRFLLEGRGKRELRVVVSKEESTPDGVTQTLLFRDPWVGTFEGVLLLPKHKNPKSAVLVFHGHGETAQRYLEDFPRIADLRARGMAVLLLTMRVNNADANEDLLSRVFLAHGFTLLGMHEYEMLLGYEYLYHKLGKHARYGLIGHSGGSTSGNLLIRIMPVFAAYVSDNTTEYWQPYRSHINDAIVPSLRPYSRAINDLSTSQIPVLRTPYGYAGQWDKIIDFFDRRLNPGAR
jgi:hypothetical protein